MKKTVKRNFYIALIIFLAALLPRLIIASASLELPSADAAGFDNLAMNILNFKVFGEAGSPSSFKEPLYPYFLAFIYSCFGHNYFTVRLLQAFLGALVCLLVFLIAKRLFGRESSYLAGFLVIFNPGLIKICEHLLSENLYLFLLIIVTYLLLKQTDKGGYFNLCALGVFLGLAALTRAVALFLPLFVVIFIGKALLPKDYSRKKHIISVFLLFFSFAVVISSWTFRNWQVHRKFIPIVSRTGLGLYSSFFPKDGKYFGFNASDSVTEKSRTLGSETKESEFLVHETVNFIRHNPLRVLKLEFLKIGYFFSLFDWEIIGYGVFNYMFGFILPFFIYAIFLLRDRINKLMPVYLPVFYSFLFCLATYGSPRFRLPIEPQISIISAGGIVYFIQRHPKKKNLCVLALGSYFLLNLFFFAHSYQIKIFFRSLMETLRLW